MALAPKSLILNLLSTLRGRPIPVRALVTAGDVFGIAEESVRVALARLLANGLVQRDERGSYRLAEKTRPIQSQIESWTEIEERVVPWNGGWVAAHTAGLPRSERKAARRRDRAFMFLGFREFELGLWLRPDNLRGSVAASRLRLQELGLETGVPVFRITEFEQAEERAADLWKIDELRESYRRMRSDLGRSAARLPKLPHGRAMVESFVLGGEAIRHMVFDPLLPEPLVPAEERRAVVAALRRYDRAGRRSWARFLARHGAPHAPIDLPVDGARAVAHA